MFKSHIRFRAYIKEKFQEVVLVLDNSVATKVEVAEDFYKAVDRITELYPVKKVNEDSVTVVASTLKLGTIAKLLHEFFLDEYTHTPDERRACRLTIEISDKDDHHLVYTPEEDVV